MARMTRGEFGDVMLSVLEKLQDRPATEEEIENSVQKECLKMWRAEQAQEESKKPSLKSIPKFFTARDPAPNGVKEQVRREARIRMLKEQETLLLDQEELEGCHALLLRHATSGRSAHSPGSESSASTNAERINWDGFCQVRDQLPDKMQSYFRPSVFLRFSRDASGSIAVLPFYQFMVCRDALLRKRITLVSTEGMLFVP